MPNPQSPSPDHEIPAEFWQPGMATVYVPSPRGPTAHATVSVNRPGKAWNDVEAAAAAEVPPMTKKTKVALAVAFVVLVVSVATAIAMIVGPGRAGSSGGSSSSSTASSVVPEASPLPAGGATTDAPASSSETPLTPEQTSQQAPTTDAAQPVAEAVPVPTPTPVPDAAAPPLVVPEGQQLLWSDEFDGTSVDTSKWTFDTDATQGALSEGSLEVRGAARACQNMQAVRSMLVGGRAGGRASVMPGKPTGPLPV